MSQANEILQKFDEFETSMKTHLGKVDPVLIVDFLLRQKNEKNSNKSPIYTLEVFIKPNQNTDEIRNRIIKETGMVPAFYDGGTHIVVAHKINFDMLKMINDIEFVERIRGTYAGGGLASIGPVYDWPFLLLYGITTFGPKLALQNKIKAMKAKMKELVLAHNNQMIA